MAVRIPRKSFFTPPVLAFFIVLIMTVVSFILLEKYDSLFLILMLYAEILSLIGLTISFLAGRRGDSGPGVKYSFNSGGILANKHLVYPWTEIKSVSFRKLAERYALPQYSSGNSRIALREIGNVPSKNGKLIPIYRTFNYGIIEVHSDFGSRASVVIKCSPSYLRAGRMIRKMQKYAETKNPSINFHLQEPAGRHEKQN